MPVSSGGFPRAIRVPRYSRIATRETARIRLPGFHLLWRSFPGASACALFFDSPRINSTSPSYNPSARSTQITSFHLWTVCYARRFGLLPFRSPLLRKYRLISVPPGTEMFHFPGLASLDYSRDIGLFGQWGSPFGNLRIKGCWAPPRSLSQPRYVLHRLLESRHPPYAL